MQLDQPHAYCLSLLRWDFFGTLTFRHMPPRGLAYSAAWSLFACGARRLDVSYSRLLITLREERGEMTNRFHFHFLLGGTGIQSRPFKLQYAKYLENVWGSMTGSPMVRIRVYDDALAGVAYVVKCLRGNEGGNQYELEKFDSSDSVTLSDSVMRLIVSLDTMTTEAAAAELLKN